jgi:hypothetical protein
VIRVEVTPKTKAMNTANTIALFTAAETSQYEVYILRKPRELGIEQLEDSSIKKFYENIKGERPQFPSNERLHRRFSLMSAK